MSYDLVIGLFSLAGWPIAGVLGLIGLFDRAQRARRKDDDDTASSLIANLKTKTDLQEKELTELRAKEISQGKEIAHLQGQVKVLSDILQGRDPAMQEFLKHAPSLVEIIRENNQLAKDGSKALTDLTTALTVFMTAMTPPGKPTV